MSELDVRRENDTYLSGLLPAPDVRLCQESEDNICSLPLSF
jgi:hypothetical protein